jgi:hypothetical protein
MNKLDSPTCSSSRRPGGRQLDSLDCPQYVVASFPKGKRTLKSLCPGSSGPARSIRCPSTSEHRHQNENPPQSSSAFSLDFQGYRLLERTGNDNRWQYAGRKGRDHSILKVVAPKVCGAKPRQAYGASCGARRATSKDLRIQTEPLTQNARIPAQFRRSASVPTHHAGERERLRLRAQIRGLTTSRPSNAVVQDLVE